MTMNVKHISGVILLFIMGLLCSCVDDPGNYDYQDIKEMYSIEISGLQDTTFVILSDVTLVPEVVGLNDNVEYEFTWYAYPNGIVGIPKRDTLSRERNLSFTMTYPSGVNYVLVYEIRDKATGYCVSEKINIKGESEFAAGWFVLKDDNEETDIDFISPEGKMNSDILFKATGEKMKGKAVKMIYQKGRYYHQVENEDGTLTTKSNLKAFHILSSKDARVVNPEDMSVYKKYEDMFYQAPAVPNPQNVLILSYDVFLVDNGFVRNIVGMSSNIGKYSYQKLGDADLDANVLGAISGGSTLLAFSHATKSFLYLPFSGTSFQYFSEQEDGLFVSPTQMNADLLQLIVRKEPDSGGGSGWALMKSIEGPQEYYLADLSFLGPKCPFADFDTIAPTREFLNADVYGNHFLNSFYFAKGNQLGYYQKNDSDKNSIEKTNIWPHFGANEKISYIAQMASARNAANPWNYLVVLTNSPEGWRMYRFTLLGDGVNPEIDQLVEPVYHGQGNARYVMFRH